MPDVADPKPMMRPPRFVDVLIHASAENSTGAGSFVEWMASPLLDPEKVIAVSLSPVIAPVVPIVTPACAVRARVPVRSAAVVPLVSDRRQ